MALRFRRSFTLVPGLRLNIGKGSVSVRAGGRGYGVTAGTAGRRVTAGLPGSGLSYTQKVRGGSGGSGWSIGWSMAVLAGVAIALSVLF